jgi:4'-phosphopantetheinyl transferase
LEGVRPLPGTDEIHLWTASMVEDGGDPHDYSDLSDEEIARVTAARSELFRHRFVRSRSLLRRLLSRYLSAPPAEIPLIYNEHGRPSVPDSAAEGLDFNLSHTDDWAVFAFGWGRRVGIDIERIDRRADWRRIARSTFSELECRQLEKREDGTNAYLRAWLRKEAYAKARGDGFAYGFSSFSVAIEPGSSTSGLLQDEHDPTAPGRWWIRDLDLDYPLAGALAGDGECREVLRWRYSAE